MELINLSESTVSAKWLYENLSSPNLAVLDASIKKVIASSEDSIAEIQIPQTRFFDIKKKFSDVNAPFPNTMPSEAQFNEAAQEIGINNNSAIVVYDDKGIYSSARVWYMFKAMGHNNIAVLDGGLPEWLRLNYPVVEKTDYKGSKGNFIGSLNADLFKSFNDVALATHDEHISILDARSSDRFNCSVPEPRAGLRRGHIPNSISLPYADLLNNGILLPKNELKKLMNSHLDSNNATIFSCGSGITACVLALGADICGYKNYAVYDGSWTEWGSLTEAE